MSEFRARAARLHTTRVDRFSWGDTHGSRSSAVEPEGPEAAGPVEPPVSPADLEREAFTRGYADGERSGLDAAANRARQLLDRLAAAAEEMVTVRGEMLRAAERQLVQLALTIAGRVLRHEVTTDRSVLVAMAHAAIERLGESASATIRVNPDDLALIGERVSRLNAEHPGVRVVADPVVPAGGCLVQSDVGLVDVGIEAQLSELARTLLGDGEVPLDEAQHRVEQSGT